MDKKEKLERRNSIGGSDAAAILGLSPWKTEMDVWLEKMGLVEEIPDPNRDFLLDLGKAMEPAIATLYVRETGRGLIVPSRRYQHPILSWLIGSPDRLVTGEKRGVELKTESIYVDRFGEPGTDEVPDHYLIQCAVYMAIMDYPVWDIALLKAGTSFTIYTIHRDAQLERDILAQLGDWWEKHVVGKTPPEIDGSPGWTAYLKKKYPRDIEPIKESDRDSLVLIHNLKAVRQIVEEYTALETELENRVKMLVGAHEGIEGEFGKITWKLSKDAEHIDWQGAFEELASFLARLHHVESPNELLKRYTKTKPGTRRFVPKFRKDWQLYGNDTKQLPAREPIVLEPAPAADPGGNGGDGPGGPGESAR
jgi:putative phage-type endonuclease